MKEVARNFAKNSNIKSVNPICPAKAAFIPSKPPPKTPYPTNEKPTSPVRKPPIAGLV